MRILLQARFDFESRNNNNETPIIKWALLAQSDLIQELTVAGADVKAVDSRRFTAYDRARMSNTIEREAVMGHLLQHYANVVFGVEGAPSLHHIYQESSYAAAGDDGSFHPPLTYLRMNTPLGQLQMQHVVALIQFLNTNVMIRKRDVNGSVPLHYACQNSAPFEILSLLRHLDTIVGGGTEGQEAGRELVVTPRCRDHQGILPIYALLATNPAVGAVTLLLEANPPSASMRALNGDFPLMVACESSASVDVIFELLVLHPDLVG